MTVGQLSWFTPNIHTECAFLGNFTAQPFSAAAAAAAANSAVAPKPTSRDICECFAGPDAWSSVVDQSFDNVFVALMTLFELSTTEGWVTVMHAAVDAVAVDMQPRVLHSEAMVIFFILYV